MALLFEQLIDPLSTLMVVKSDDCFNGHPSTLHESDGAAGILRQDQSLFVSCPELEAILLKEATSLSSSNVIRGPRFYAQIRLEKNHTLFKLESPETLVQKYSLNEEEVNKIIEATDGIIELYQLFGCANQKSSNWLQRHRFSDDRRYTLSLATAHCRYRTIHRLLMLSKLNGLGSWVKFLKWKFAAYFSFYMKEDIPEKPDFKWPERHGKVSAFFSETVLLGGYLEDLICSLRLKKNGRFYKRSLRLSFLISTQQLKKVMPSVPLDFIEESVNKTVVELTSPPVTHPGIEILSELGYDIKIDRSFIEQELRRTISEIFDGKFISEEELFEPFFPSTSANYINSRGECGSLNILYEKSLLGNNGSDLLNFGVEVLPCTDHVAKKYGAAGKAEQSRIDALKEAGWEQAELERVLCYDDTNLRLNWRGQYLKLYSLALEEEPLVKAIGLSEPLKVRVISKGPPLLYTFLKPFQKWMWKTLKQNRVFSLIGRYVTEDDINRVLGEPVDFETNISGDYVSSTNKIHSWVSEVLIDQLFIEFGEAIPSNLLHQLPKNFLVNLKKLFLRAMVNHVFDHDGRKLPQLEGQLMGSIISFVFLCLANAALCRASIECSYGGTKKFRLTDQPYWGSGPIAKLLVNGDDCLLNGLKELRRFWESICLVAGLESSLGKTYFSSEFCTINSTTFVWSVKNFRWEEHKYVNLGLMKGLQRTKGKTEKVLSSRQSAQVGIHQLGTICRELKRSCPPELWSLVKSRFIYYNKNQLDSFEGGLPWFLPEWLGGVGLPIDNSNELSDLDRRTATVLKYNYAKEAFKIVKPKDMDTWLMHRRVQRDLKPFGLSEVNYRTVHMDGPHDLEVEYSRLYKLMTFNLLNKESLESLWTDVKKDQSVKRSIRNNIKSIGRARREVSNNFGLYTPMSDEDLNFENKRLVIPTIAFNSEEVTWMSNWDIGRG